jgi:flagellar basal-body rod protein FlgF
MDRLIYTAMTGAKQAAEQQATVANNLANVGTSGFRAQIDAFRAVPIPGKGMETRTQVQSDTVAADFTPGVIQQTGRSLDVAVLGGGWLAVQGGDGREAYTRSGSLKISPNGLLQTQGGQPVLGDGGQLTVPPDAQLLIARDGTVSALQRDTVPAVTTVVGRLKLVNPPQAALRRGDDGLFRGQNGAPFEADASVTVESGALESSNVNVVDAMVRMIALGRQFDTQMSLLKNAESNAAKAGQVLNLN